MMREEIRELLKLGRFPASRLVDNDVIRAQQDLLSKIEPPVSDDEAKRLVGLFGPDDYFGLAWTLLHLVETAPSWPIAECLIDVENEWIRRLKNSAERARRRGL